MTLSERFWKHNLKSPQIKKFYDDRCKFIKWVDKRHLNGKAKKLLDVGCGNGRLDSLLSKRYDVTGIDIDGRALAMAKKIAPEARFMLNDMRTFRSGERYDIIISSCAIDHGDELRSEFEKTLKNLSDHLNDNGALIFDLVFAEEFWKKNTTTQTTFKNGSELYVHVFHREVEKGSNDGLFYQVTTLIKGNMVRSETGPVYRKPMLLSLKKTKRLTHKLGFKFFLYDGWQNKLIKTVKKEAPVCILIKKKKYDPNEHALSLLEKGFPLGKMTFKHRSELNER